MNDQALTLLKKLNDCFNDNFLIRPQLTLIIDVRTT